MAKIADLRMGTTKGYSPIATFRQLVADGGIEFDFGIVKVKPKEKDLPRIHDIIHEIDDRRVFYNAYEDEIPEHMVTSLRDAKRAIHECRKGLWSNPWARRVVEILLHNIGEFLTFAEKKPLPRNHHDAGFPEFECEAEKLRMQIWSLVAHMVVVFGDDVKPLHLPPEILSEVKLAYDTKLKAKKPE
jgi:hypothetical protein